MELGELHMSIHIKSILAGEVLNYSSVPVLVIDGGNMTQTQAKRQEYGVN
jgi:hypothetical protein